MFTRKPVVAVLDDEPNMRSALKRLLTAHGFEVELFESGTEFLVSAQSRCPDCLLLDLHMPPPSGFDVLGSMSSLRIEAPVIVITGHDEPGNLERVKKLGAAEYLTKPLDETRLMEAIGQVRHGSGSAPDGPLHPHAP